MVTATVTEKGYGSDALAAGRPVDRLAVGVAAWMAFVVRQTLTDAPLTDPLAASLTALARTCDGTAADVARFLAIAAVFPPPLSSAPRFRQHHRRTHRQPAESHPRSLSIHRSRGML